MRSLLAIAALVLSSGTAFAGVALDACAMQAADPFEKGYEDIGVYSITNTDAAIGVCQRAVTIEGTPEAKAWLARAYYAAGRDGDALPLAQDAGRQGNLLGLMVAGDILSGGFNGEVDIPAGIALLTQSSDGGFAPAQTSLGYDYEIGQGVTLDAKKAMELYRLAAAQGYGVAEANVGIHYRDGLGGLEVDLDEAIKWFKKAVEHGDSGGQDALGYAYEYGEGVPQDYEKAAYYYGLAAAQGNENAMGNLGYAYDSGHGVPQDYAKALELYKQADANGSTWVASYIGALYLDGLGTDQNIEEARTWIRKGLEGGDYYAMYLMGRIAEEGIGGPVDITAAKDWYQKAEEAGSEEATEALARLFKAN